MKRDQSALPLLIAALAVLALVVLLLAAAHTSPGIQEPVASSASKPAVSGSPSAAPSASTAAAPSDDWAAFGLDASHTFYNPVSGAGAPQLQWSVTPANAISGQPIAVHGTLYWGSWDGVFHATDANTGRALWSTFLGQHPTGKCGWYPIALTGSPAAADVHGTSAVIVAGGDGKLHALRAADGAMLWATSIADVPGGEYVWGSPVVALGSVYVGISSFDDCSGASGKVLRVALASGAIQSSFTPASGSCVGGSIWSTPTVDVALQTVYVATGNPLVNQTTGAACSTRYMQAVVALNATSLTPISSWQVPADQLNNDDSDFGATPTLFTARVSGATRLMLGVANKNGLYYAFDRTNIAQGPLWYTRAADGGANPQGGQGSIATSAFDGARLYVAGGQIHGCRGSIRALDPATGRDLWIQCLNDTVLGAVTATAAAVFTTCGTQVRGFRSDSGQPFFSYTGSGIFYSAITIVPGLLSVGNIRGTLYAFSWG